MASELEAGSGVWSNIAPIIRQTFSIVTSKLKEQRDKLRGLERAIAEERKERKHEIDRLAETVRDGSSLAAVSAANSASKLDEEAKAKVRALELEVADLRAKMAEISAAMPRRDELQRVLAKKVDVVTLEEVIESLPDRRTIAKFEEDMQAAVQDQLRSFQRKISDELLKRESSEDLTLLRNTITSELLLGRWLFSIDRAAEIPRLREAINTAQLLYEQVDDSTIRVQRKGIYEVQFSVFSTGPSQAQLLVNGEVLISSDTASSKTRPTVGSSRRASLANALPSSCSLHECVLLETGSELSLRVSSDKCQGFIGVRNLFCDPGEDE